MFARHPTLVASTVTTVTDVPAFNGGVWIKPSGSDVYGTIDGTFYAPPQNSNVKSFRTSRDAFMIGACGGRPAPGGGSTSAMSTD